MINTCMKGDEKKFNEYRESKNLKKSIVCI